MQAMFKRVLPIVMLPLLAACGSDTRIAEPEERDIETIADEYLAAMLERFPSTATYYSIPGARHDDLFDNSLEARTAWEAREDAWIAELEAISPLPVVGTRDWVTYGVLSARLVNSAATRICRSELWSASSIMSWHNNLPSLFELQPLDTAEAKAQALTRLGKVASYIDTEIANLRTGLELGYSAPQVTVVTVPGEVRALLEDDNPFLMMLARAEDQDFETRGRQLFDNEIAPALERFASFIEDEYMPQAREEISLSANPDGAACYPALVRSYSTLAISADEIHQTGLEELQGILDETESVIDEFFGGENVSQFFQRVITDREFTFDTEEQVLQHSLGILAAVRERMDEYFDLMPVADVEIRPYPAYRGAATGEYQSSSEDGSRPGVFLIPVTAPTRRSRAVQQTLLHHETYPGHHLQGAIALELGDKVHPVVRYTWNAGFGEGWGLYAERLADEMGMYENDPLGRVGMFSDQAARAARLVIDTGLHTKGWTRQQALDYLRANSAWSDVDVSYEIDRYIGMPGQATAYMLGSLEIFRLRALARDELGAEFDIRQFHNKVVENGSVTLPMLEAAITNWLESR